MLTRTAPDTGLLSSLGAWTWPGTAPDGRQVAHILLAHRLGRTSHDTPEAIEARMRHLTQILGGLARAQDPVPDTQGALVTIGPRSLLKFPGARWGLRLPAHRQWTRLVQGGGRAVLIVGLDPLTQSADAVRVDAYLDAGITADRLLFGFARTSRSA
ncbi:hypothetical protein [Streptomyces sp. NPDC054797]